MKKKWLTIIGIGEEGMDALSHQSRQIIAQAELIIGGTRHLAMLSENLQAKTMTWLSPLSDTVRIIAENTGAPVVILASGDPMDFGIGVTLARHFRDDEIQIIPAVGAFSHALSRMGWARHETHCLTLHGRPLKILNPYLQPETQLLLLANDGASPHILAKHLCARKFSQSPVTVLSHMGADEETRDSFIADTPPDKKFPDLNVMAVALVADSDMCWHSLASGIPANAYRHQGTITKPEVRAATLGKLKPRRDALLWDIGAGAGSIAIEWARLGGSAIAIEKNAQRCRDIAANIASLGTDKIEIISGDILDHLEHLPAPDAIFIGGGLTMDLAQNAFKKLAKGGRFVINAVTMESQMILYALASQETGKLCRISVAHLVAIGQFHSFKQSMDVMQWVQEKQ